MIHGPCRLLLRRAPPREERQFDVEIEDLQGYFRRLWKQRRYFKSTRDACRLVLRQLRAAYSARDSFSDEGHEVVIRLGKGETLSESRVEARPRHGLGSNTPERQYDGWTPPAKHLEQDEDEPLFAPSYSAEQAHHFWCWLQQWKRGLVQTVSHHDR